MTCLTPAPAPTGQPDALLYLHGFRSSPGSFKARRLQAWLAAHRPEVAWHCPQLPPSPREAFTLMQSIIGAHPGARWCVVGSSLGGFYAAVIGEWLAGCGTLARVAVINPAVDPARDLRSAIGELTVWHDPAERFHFRADFIEELQLLRPAKLTHLDRYFAIIATGDEVLDWREMRDRHAGARLRIVEGSDHALSDFEAHLEPLVDFLGLAAP
jgi:uncharacterized protein